MHLRALTPCGYWVALALLVAACSTQAHSSNDERRTSGIGDPFSDEGLRTAAGCPGCRILHRARLKLPETGIAAVSAKLATIDSAGFFSTQSITVRSDATVTSEAELLGAEAKARRARLGKFTAELRAHASVPTAEVAVWIWLRPPGGSPRKEDLLENPSLMLGHQSELKARLSTTASPVTAVIAASKGRVLEDGSGSPLIRAVVPSTALPTIEALPQVDQMGIDKDFGALLTCSWVHGVRPIAIS